MISEFRGQTKWLSNYHQVKITYEGLTYNTTEAAYQAAKTLDPEIKKKFAEFTTGGEARGAGQVIAIRPDWDQIKIQVMKDVNKLKFSQLEFKEKLLATGDAELVEGNNHGDTFWGVVNGVGQNNLGKVLMEIREELKQQQPPTTV